MPAQRSSHSHTLREIPAIVGLTFLAPQQYVTAYVLGGGLALLLWSRLRGLKLAFNVAMFALEAAVGALVYHLVLAVPTRSRRGRGWPPWRPCWSPTWSPLPPSPPRSA